MHILKLNQLTHFITEPKLRSLTLKLGLILGLSALVAANLIPHAIWTTFSEYSFVVIVVKELLSRKKWNLTCMYEQLLESTTQLCDFALGS